MLTRIIHRIVAVRSGNVVALNLNRFSHKNACMNLNNNMYTNYTSFNFKSYNSDEIKNHLINRRIVTNPTDNPSDILQRTIDNICNIEFLNKNNWNLSEIDIITFRNELSYAIDSKLLGFGTPILTNLGQSSQPNLAPMACTVLNLPQSNSISDLIDHIQPSAIKGQGLGFDLTSFEDPVSMLNTLNDIFLKIDKNCVRTVAGMATLSSSHNDIIPFIKSKKEYDFSKGRFNISIKMRNSDIEISDDNNNGLIQSISECIHYCGEPGILFVDQLEYDNPISCVPYLSTAPCAEIAMSEGDGCHFGYLNLSNFVHKHRIGNPIFNILDKIDWELLEQITRITTRMLDNTVEISSILGQESVINKRRIGVGICGFSDLLLSLNIPYDSNNAKLLSSEIMNFINFISKITSIELSSNRGSFNYYNKSNYKNEKWLKRNEYKYSNNIKIGNIEWKQYYNDIKKFGIRNATTTSLPPSGNASLVLNASQSIEPYFNLLNRWNSKELSPKIQSFLKKQSSFRKDINVEMIKKIIIDNNGILPDPDDNNHNIDIPNYIHSVLKTATQISPESHIDIVSEFQKHLDDSVAKTINLPNKCDINYIEYLIKKSYYNGLKGVTFFRDGCLNERN